MFTINDAIRSLENRDLNTAKNLFNKLILESDLSSIAHAGLANCYARENNLTIAKRELEESMKLGEIGLLSSIAYALIADREGNSKEAERYFTQATKIESKSSYANLMLGSFLLVRENNEDAIRFLLKAKQVGGNKWVVNRNLAIAYSRTGKRYESFKVSFLSFISRPSKQSFELVYGSFFQAFRVVLLIIFGICLVFFFLAAGTIQGVVVPTVALIAFEYARYVIEKNSRSLRLILFYLVLGVIYYLVFVK